MSGVDVGWEAEEIPFEHESTATDDTANDARFQAVADTTDYINGYNANQCG